MVVDGMCAADKEVFNRVEELSKKYGYSQYGLGVEQAVLSPIVGFSKRERIQDAIAAMFQLLDTTKSRTQSQTTAVYPGCNLNKTPDNTESESPKGTLSLESSNANDEVISSSYIAQHQTQNTPLENQLIQERVNLLLRTKGLVLQNKMEIKKVLRKFTEEYTELKLTEEFLEQEIEIWSNKKIPETTAYDGGFLQHSDEESITEDVASIAILFNESGNNLENKESLSGMTLEKVKKREKFKARLKMFGYLNPFNQLPEKGNFEKSDHSPTVEEC
ncbi:unnamed protein product [Ambrosiozyma monospora]|uniref:Unnamed protein product n=1 Tax=Ambrosiozyma monospora TaxID=43982 RepID=A0A9W6YWN7_AMBMO|nr:unnamed protein product [Ambrosiozyma monospora]